MKAIVGCCMVAASLISGCSSTVPQVVSSDSYVLDTEKGLLCRYTDCYDLSLIVPSPYEQRIVNAYNLSEAKFSWTQEDLQRLLLEDSSYAVEKLSDSEYKLPANSRTNTVYSVLQDEFDLLYAGKGGEVSGVLGKIKGVKLDQDIERPH